jgi:hypothetical protein
VRRIPRFRQSSLHSIKRRLGVALRRHLLGRFLPEKRVRRIWIGGAACKRVTLPDVWSATELAHRLEHFRSHRVFPAVIAQMGNELLLEYVEGAALPDPLDAASCEQLAAFFAVLYAHERHAVESRRSGVLDGLQRDLAFLAQAGVLAAEAARELAEKAGGLAPAQLHVGYDYLDPIPRNFLRTPAGRLLAVDVEELMAEQLLGSGVAKALLRTPGASREILLDGIRRHAGLDLAPQMPFVELAFLAGWTKRALLKGREKLVQPALFEPWRRSG